MVWLWAPMGGSGRRVSRLGGAPTAMDDLRELRAPFWRSLTHLPTQRMGLENETRKRVGVAMGGVHRKDPFDQWNTTRS